MRAAAKKVFDHRLLAAMREVWRTHGCKVVFAQGCFDLIHVGHVRYLEFCKSQGDVLVVGVLNDEFVGQWKGSGRPFIKEEERVEVVAALGCVDYVTIYEEITAVSLLEFLRPDVYVDDIDYYPSSEAKCGIFWWTGYGLHCPLPDFNYAHC